MASAPVTTLPSPTAPAAGSSPARFAVLDADLTAEWHELLGRSSALAVDTEAMGLVHGRDRLCLVQISDDQDNVCCIRILRGQSDKGAQSSDWGRVEELSEAQLAYAANDVRYLLPARERLIQMLEREERLDLAQRSFQCIPVIAELDRGRFGAIFEHRS
jgi:ribonuclease D